MITLKGAEVSAKIKEQVLSMNQELNGYVPTAAIVRIGERPELDTLRAQRVFYQS